MKPYNLISSFFLTVCLIAQTGQAQTLVVPDNGSTWLVGRGYDTITNSVGDQCVTTEGQTLVRLGGDGGIVSWSYVELENRRDLQELLSLGLSGGFGYGDFEGSIKSQWFSSRELTEYNYYLAARVTVSTQSQVLPNYSLTENAKALLATDPEAFNRVCGDAFIASRVTGGEFLALLRFKTKTKEELRSLKDQYRSGFEVVEVGTDIEVYLKEKFQEHSGKIDVIRRGGVSAVPNFSDPVALKNYMSNFPVEIAGQGGSPITYSVELFPYDRMIQIAGMQVFDVTSARAIIRRLSASYSKALDAYDNSSYIFENIEEFPTADMQTVVEIRDDAATKVNKIREAAEACEAAPFDTQQCKLLNASEVLVDTSQLPDRDNVVYVLEASNNCPLIGYETREVLDSCNTPSLGTEVTDRRSETLMLKGFYDRAVSVSDQQLSSYCKKRFSQGDVSSQLQLDINLWNLEVAKGSGPVQQSSCSAPNPNVWTSELEIAPATGNGFPTHMCLDCQFTFIQSQGRFGPHRDCGVTLVPDTSQPIYEPCRHPAHGIEDN